MRCQILSRQSEGRAGEVILNNMVCDQAPACRRRGVCILSDQAGLRTRGTERLPDGNAGIGEPVYLALAFDQSLGFFWKQFPGREQAETAAIRAQRKFDAPLLIKKETWLSVSRENGGPQLAASKGISDPLTARELARRITRDLVRELEDEELKDIDTMFPALRSKIEFSRECYLKMINDDVKEKRDYFDKYFRHYFIERLIVKMDGNEAADQAGPGSGPAGD